VPCGFAVEWVRSSYQGVWRLFRGVPGTKTPGRYVFLPDDAPHFPFPHFYGSADWVHEPRTYIPPPPLGEDKAERRSWDSGQAVLPVPPAVLVGEEACFSLGEPNATVPPWPPQGEFLPPQCFVMAGVPMPKVPPPQPKVWFRPEELSGLKVGSKPTKIPQVPGTEGKIIPVGVVKPSVWLDYPSQLPGFKLEIDAGGSAYAALAWAPALPVPNDFTVAVVVREYGPGKTGPLLFGGVGGNFTPIKYESGVVSSNFLGDGAFAVQPVGPLELKIWLATREGTTWKVYDDQTLLVENTDPAPASDIASFKPVADPAKPGVLWLGELLFYDRALNGQELADTARYLKLRFPA